MKEPAIVYTIPLHYKVQYPNSDKDYKHNYNNLVASSLIRDSIRQQIYFAFMLTDAMRRNIKVTPMNWNQQQKGLSKLIYFLKVQIN